MPALRARTLLERGRTHTIVLGAGRTLMLACLSPSSAHLDESMNTLHFASRAKNIANRPAVQIDQQAVPALLVACATWRRLILCSFTCVQALVLPCPV